VSTVRSSLIACWLAVPFLAICLLGCSKEGGGSNPTVKEKAPELKKLIPGGGDKGVNDAAKPSPN
jgi:hypothetical protein